MSSWTDERIDDLAKKVDDGFDRVDRRFTEFGEQVDRRFDQVDKRFEQVDYRFEQVDKRFDKVDFDIGALRGDMTAGFEAVTGRVDRLFFALVAGMVGTIATLIGAIVTYALST